MQLTVTIRTNNGVEQTNHVDGGSPIVREAIEDLGFDTGKLCPAKPNQPDLGKHLFDMCAGMMRAQAEFTAPLLGNDHDERREAGR